MKLHKLTIAILSFALFSFLATAGAWGQDGRIARLTQQNFKQHAPTSYMLYNKSSVSLATDFVSSIKNIQEFNIIPATLQRIVSEKPATMVITLPSQEGELEVHLYQYDFFDKDFAAFALTDNGTYQEITYKKGAYYRGYVNGIAPSLAVFSFFDEHIIGMISTQKAGNYNYIARPDKSYNTPQYLVYNDIDVIDKEHLAPRCAVDDYLQIPNEPEDNAPTTPPNISELGSCRSVTVALHADYRAYLRNNSDLNQTQNYLTALHNANSTLYANDDMQLSLKHMYVNQVNDNYPTNSSTAVLNKFGNDINTNVTADLHQMISGYRNSNNFAPLGGLAWLDVLCRTPRRTSSTYVGPFSMVNNNSVPNAIRPLPAYSWDVCASSHEFGHNIGSRHTHWCGWPGGAIDGCVAVENDNNNNSCTRPPNPTGGGTIMSYCHLNNTGVNFNNGFGPLPKALMMNKISNASCVSSVEGKKSVDTANVTVTANAMCDDGEWYLFYYDNNTSTSDDDIMVIALKKSDVGTINMTQSQLSMTTTSTYKSGNTVTVAGGYKPNAAWNETNRTWAVNIQPAPAGTVNIKLPILSTDFTELQIEQSITLSQIKLLSFNNASPMSPNNISLLDYNNALNSGQWFYSPSTAPLNGDYFWAAAHLPNNTFGIRFGYGKGATHISAINTLGINVYPNPAKDYVQITNTQSAPINSVSVIDALGRTVFATHPKGNSADGLRIDTQLWAAGIYSIVFEIDQKVYSYKIVKE